MVVNWHKSLCVLINADNDSHISIPIWYISMYIIVIRVISITDASDSSIGGVSDERRWGDN